MKYAYIDDHKWRYEIQLMCDVLEVSRSGYYAWLNRSLSSKILIKRRHMDAIKEEFNNARQAYGSPRIYRALKRLGYSISKRTVARYMKAMSLVARSKKRFKVKTTFSNHNEKIAPNHLNQNFEPNDIGEVLLGDITYIKTGEGFLYLSGVMDLYTRELVGYQMSDNLSSESTLQALEMAHRRTEISSDSIFHSDRGIQYASESFRGALKHLGLKQSMSGKGNCYDNAPMESFFHTLKCEFIHHERFETRKEAKQKIFEWIEVFYNRKRMHSSLGYKSPYEFKMELQGKMA